MPALRYMGRRWGIGADELALPSLCSMMLRVVWTVALVVILVRDFSKLHHATRTIELISFGRCSCVYIRVVAVTCYVSSWVGMGRDSTWAHIRLSSPLSAC